MPPALLAFAGMLWLLRRRDAVTVPRVVVGVAVCVYGAGVVANTLLPIYLGYTGDRPRWSVYLNLVPLVNTDPADMIQNVLVFLPLGVLLPIAARVDSVLRVLLCGFMLSFTMELLQFVNAVTGHGGHIADINDLLANTVGAPVGYAVFRAALLVPPLARLVAAMTWPPRTLTSATSDHTPD